MAEDNQVSREKIGSVTMDYTYYAGQDLYSDGAIEDKMLDIAMNNPPEDFPSIIETEKSWPVFYHFSPLRTNIIDWIPFKKTDKVLEIGSGCGAITGALAKRAGKVTCVELSRKRSMINAWRNRNADNVTILVGNFKDIEPHLDKDYDYVLLIGVFEYGQAYIGGASPYEDFLRICNCHRKLDGRLIIAIENKFGLKYWAGCREDHLGTYFSGIEGYHGGGTARTFTRHGLEKLLERTGIFEYAFYYPYPDYKFTTSIYSDQYLPKKGELHNNLRNFDMDRILLFDEKQVFDEIIDEQEFPLFSNSYLLMVGGAPNVIYTKFSNDRASKWAVRTSIVKDTPKHVHVEKMPDTEAACSHLMNTMHAYELLSARYEGTKIDINRCGVVGEDIKNGLSFEFCKGKTLEELLDECLKRADVAGFKALVEEYMHWLSYNEDVCAVSNFDFIFSNILVDGDKWHIIDYEWTFDRHIAAKDIAFRAFYNYTLGSEMRKACEDLLMKDILGMTDEEIADAVSEEREFQLRITGNHASAERMWELLGNKAHALVKYFNHVDQKYIVQIFVDYGEGFCEDNSVRLLGCYTVGRYMKVEYDIPKAAVRVRIDPCMYPCVVDIRQIKAGDRLYTAEDFEVNGCWQECGLVVFDSEDPNVIINVSGGEHLVVDMDVLELPPVFASQLVQGAHSAPCTHSAQPVQDEQDTSKDNFVTKTKGFFKAKLRGEYTGGRRD